MLLSGVCLLLFFSAKNKGSFVIQKASDFPVLFLAHYLSGDDGSAGLRRHWHGGPLGVGVIKVRSPDQWHLLLQRTCQKCHWSRPFGVEPSSQVKRARQVTLMPVWVRESLIWTPPSGQGLGKEVKVLAHSSQLYFFCSCLNIKCDLKWMHHEYWLLVFLKDIWT